MKAAVFNAFCPYEIGDKLIIGNGKDLEYVVRTITDIAGIHYVRTGDVKFMYEFDNSGRYLPLVERKENTES